MPRYHELRFRDQIRSGQLQRLARACSQSVIRKTTVQNKLHVDSFECSEGGLVDAAETTAGTSISFILIDGDAVMLSDPGTVDALSVRVDCRSG